MNLTLFTPWRKLQKQEIVEMKVNSFVSFSNKLFYQVEKGEGIDQLNLKLKHQCPKITGKVPKEIKVEEGKTIGSQKG